MDGTLFELGTDGPSRILVGIDGTDTSMRAAAYAAGMARRQGSHLIALYVAATPPMAAVADELRVDAVVVGASMQSGRRFVGSLAGRLVRDAKWPVTVVP